MARTKNADARVSVGNVVTATDVRIVNTTGEDDDDISEDGYLFVDKAYYHEHAIQFRNSLEDWIKKEHQSPNKNKFFIGCTNQESWWPHTFKSNVWMKAVMPKACMIDLNYEAFFPGIYHKKQHAVVSSNYASRVLCGPMKYKNHHSDPKFVNEYDEYVLGMIYKYKILVQGLIGPQASHARQNIHKNQIVFVENHLQQLASAVHDFHYVYDKQPIGKYNGHYLLSAGIGLETEEDLAFVLGMANCEKFEIWIEHKKNILYDEYDDDNSNEESNEEMMLLCTRFVFLGSDGEAFTSERNYHTFGLFKRNKHEYPSSNVPYKWPFMKEQKGNKKRKWNEHSREE